MVVNIPRLTLKRMCKEIIPETRIRDKALQRLQIETYNFIRATLFDAKKYAEHSKRKSILEDDVIASLE